MSRDRLNRPIVSVVLPAYNESSSLPDTIQNLTHFLSSTVDSHEIIVVDDGSSDGTAALLVQDKRIIHLRHLRRLGKGAALQTGLEFSSGHYIAYTDADLPIAATDLVAAIQLLQQEQLDLVVGSRRHPSSTTIGSGTVSRRFISWLFALCIRLTLLPGVADAQCCMKVFRAEALHDILQYTTLRGYGFDVELLYLARRHQLRMIQCPVTWRDLRADLGPLGSARLFARMVGEAASILPRHCSIRGSSTNRGHR